jgi:hypothetical protein
VAIVIVDPPNELLQRHRRVLVRLLAHCGAGHGFRSATDGRRCWSGDAESGAMDTEHATGTRE